MHFLSAALLAKRIPKTGATIISGEERRKQQQRTKKNPSLLLRSPNSRPYLDAAAGGDEADHGHQEDVAVDLLLRSAQLRGGLGPREQLVEVAPRRQILAAGPDEQVRAAQRVVELLQRAPRPPRRARAPPAARTRRGSAAPSA